MAAKLLHSLTDDNPELQKQIGCMTGIFQIFDRHHVVTGRRLTIKRHPAGSSHFNNGSPDKEYNNSYHGQRATEMNLNKSINEKQSVSTESSRASFSSSCSSSLSSLECSKISQAEASSFDHIIFPETPSREPLMNQASMSPHSGRQSLDLQDVVKDSMYKETRRLSVKTTTKEEAVSCAVKHIDSPRPLQLPKSVEGAYGVEMKGNQNVPVDLKESLRVLAKLQEAPWYFNEARELPRSSSESKDEPLLPISRDAPRYSCDGREVNRLSFESRDIFKSTTKLKEQPRLSLDSRAGSMRSSNSDSKPNYLLKDSRKCDGQLNDKVHNLPQSLGTQQRPPSVVAKLIGLEALPDFASARDRQLCLIKTCSVENRYHSSRSLVTNDPNRSVRVSNSPRNSMKGPTSPRWKNPDSVMKPILNSRFPIDPAPWRQQDGSRVSQKPASRPVKVPAKPLNFFPSVYGEIEKRLKDLEFKQSGKDLRALKQILDAMQAKGLFETRKEEQASNFIPQRDYEPKCSSPNQNPRLVCQRNSQSNQVVTSVRGADSSRTCESPIVIMKPAKLVEKSGIPASSMVPMDGFSGLHKLQSGGFSDSKTNSRTAKDQIPKNSRRDSAVNSTDKKTIGRNVRSVQLLTKSQPLPKENITSSLKSSGSVSPRLQQKKFELEKRSRPPTPPSDSTKLRKKSNRQPTESDSPGRKLRAKSPSLRQSDDQLSEISNESKMSFQEDDTSLQLDSNTTLDLKSDVEVTSIDRSAEINGSQSLSLKATKALGSGSVQKKSSPRLVEDGSLAELATVAPEHPSPVSVLDASVYKDDEPSPVGQITNALEGGGAQNSTENHCDDQWNHEDKLLSNNMRSGYSADISRTKLQNIEHLVQKLRRLNSNHDEASTDYIASLCENTNPDHRYISEILLASGLLLRDLGSNLTTFQLHSSGHPINPELFFVLEQTKASTLPPKEEYFPGKAVNSKPDQENFRRKLIFDAVNEILVGKLSSVGALPEPWLKPNKLGRKSLSAQKLLKELCLEIEQLQANKSWCSLEDEEDGLKRILWEDVMHRSESWTDFHSEISGAVLNVERLLFKDLVDEIVICEVANMRAKQGRRRQLFAK